MRKTHNIIYTLLALMVAAVFTACSDNDKYEWAGKVAEGNPGAYFAASNVASELLTTDEYANHQKFNLTVKRANSKGSLSVPIIVDQADNVFTIPSTAEFKDGETETQVEIGCPNLETKKKYKFKIHLAEDMTDPYTQTNGSPVFNYDVLVANWVKVVDQAQFVWAKSEFSTTKSAIYWLDGQNRFRIENWLGSGIDWQFQIVAQDKVDNSKFSLDNFNANDRSTWHGALQPYNHSLMDPYGGSYWWFMYDVDNEEYASWYPDGEDNLGIYYVNFYYDITSDTYASVDLRGSSKSYAMHLTPYVYYSDGTESGYTYVYGYWSSMSEASTK